MKSSTAGYTANLTAPIWVWSVLVAVVLAVGLVSVAGSGSAVAQGDAGSTRGDAFDLGDVTSVGIADSAHAESVGASGDGVDYFEFSLLSERLAGVLLSGMSQDADVFVEDGAGTVLASRVEVGNVSEMLNVALEAGSYFVRVQSSGPRTEYVLRVGTAEVDGVAAGFDTAVEAQVGGCFRGTDARISPWWDLDRVRVDLTAGEVYVLEVRGVDSGSGTLVDPELSGVYVDEADTAVYGAYEAADRLHSAGGGRVRGNGLERDELEDFVLPPDSSVQQQRAVFTRGYDLDDGVGNEAWLLFRAAATGAHYIEVESAGGFVGSYAVAVAAEADAPAVCAEIVSDNSPPMLVSPAQGLTAAENTQPQWALSVVDGDPGDAVTGVRLERSSPAGFFELVGSLAGGDLGLRATAALDHEAGAGEFAAVLVMTSGSSGRELTETVRWSLTAGDVDEPPTAVQGLSAAVVSSTAVTLRWDASVCSSVTTCPAIGYEVFLWVGSVWSSLVEDVSTLSYTAVGLEPETTYQFRVDAGNDEGATAGDGLEVTTAEQADCAGDITTGCVLEAGDSAEDIGYVGDTDWYAAELSAGVDYEISVTGGSGAGELAEPVVKVYDHTGAAVVVSGVVVEDRDEDNDGTATVVFTPSGDGTYFVEAAEDGGDGTGTYTVSLSVGDSPPRFDEGDTRPVSVAEYAELSTQINASDPDSDPVQFSLVAPLSGGAADYESFTIDASSGVLAFVESVTVDHEATAVYEVTVEAVAGGKSVAQTVTVTVTDVECTADDTTGCWLGLGRPQIEEMGTAGDVDWFEVDLDGGIHYVMWVVGGTDAAQLGDPAVALYGADSVAVTDQGGDALADADSDGDDVAVVTFAPDSDGTFYIAVSEDGNDAAGAYSVNVGELDCAGDITTTCRADPDGYDLNTDGRVGIVGDVDWYAAELLAGTDYQISVAGTSGTGALADPVVKLYDDAGAAVFVSGVAVEDRDADNDGTATVAYTALSYGVYFIEVAEDGDDATGEYVLTLEVTNSPPRFLDPFSTDLYIRERFDVALVENTDLELEVLVVDDDDDDTAAGYSIVGGADEALFGTDADGVLTMTFTPDFETPQDSDNDNVYEVQLQATSGTGDREKTKTVLIAVNVTDDDTEPPGRSNAEVVDEQLDSVTVKWDMAESEGPPITDYVVTRRELPDGEWSNGPSLDPSDLDDVVGGLDSGVVYELAVSARNGEGESVSPSVIAYTDECAAAVVGSCELSVGGEILARVNVFDTGTDADWFEVGLEAGAPYVVEVEGSDGADALGDPVVKLFDSVGAAVLVSGTAVEDFDADGDGVARVAYTPQSDGTYYVEVSENGGDAVGGYMLLVSTEDACAGSTATGCTVAVGGSVGGTIDGPNDVDWYGVTFEANTVYTLYIASRSGITEALADPLLVGVYDSSGVFIEGSGDADSGAGGNSYKAFTSTAGGTYYVAVGRDSGAPGGFTLFVASRLPGVTVPEPPGGDFSAQAGTPGHILVGEQAPGGFARGGDEDAYAVSLEAGRVYRIEARGACDADAALAGGTATFMSIALLDSKGVRSHPSAVHLNAFGVFRFSNATRNQCVAASMNIQVLEPLYAWVLVSEGANHIGTYTVSVADVSALVSVPEPPGGDVAAAVSTAGRVAAGGSVTGEINPNGDVDWFALELVAGTAYRIDARGASTTEYGGTLADSFVSLLASDGSALSPPVSDDNTGADNNARVLSFTPTSSGAFFVEVKDPDSVGVGIYTLSVSLADACAASISTACTVDVDSAAAGTIGELSDVDWYAATLAEGVAYTLYVAPRGDSPSDLEDPELVGVYDSSGTLVAGTADADSGSGEDSYTVFTPSAAGTFYVAVGRDAGGFGDFTLFVVRREPAATVPEPPGGDVHGGAGTSAHLLSGDEVTGTVSHQGDADAVGVRLEAGRVYRLEARAACDLDPRRSGGTLSGFSLSLDDAAGARSHTGIAAVNTDHGFLAEHSAATCEPASLDVQALDTVLVYARITTSDTTNPVGTYTLSMTDISAHTTVAEPTNGDVADDATTAGRLAVGASVLGDINPDGDVDWYAAELDAGAAYRIDVHGNNATDNGGTLADPSVSVLDSDGDALSPAVSDDNSGTGNNARIAVFTPVAAGTYYIAVADPDDTGTGTYTLTLTPGNDCPDDTATTCEATVDGTVNGTVHADDDIDWYKATLVADEPYTLYVAPAGSGAGNLQDPKIVGVYNSSGTLIAGSADADSGTGEHSYVSFTPDTAGIYFVAVGRDSAETGAFTLWVTRRQPGATVPEPTGGDLPAHVGTIGHLLADEQATGNIDNPTDDDLYGVRLEAGRVYLIDARGACDADSALHGGTLQQFTLSLENDQNDSSVAAHTGIATLLAGSQATAFSATVTQGCGAAGLHVIMQQSALLYLRIAPLLGQSGTYTVNVDDITAVVSVSEPADGDLPADTTTTGRAGTGATATGFIATAGDTDWFAIELETGSVGPITYQIDVHGDSELAYGGTLEDPYVTLLDSDGNPLTPAVSNDNSGYNNNARIRDYVAATSGVHYLEVKHANGTGTGTYTVVVYNPPPTQSETPRNVQLIRSGRHALTVLWDPPAVTGGAAVTAYEVEWRSARDGYEDYDDPQNRRKAVTGTGTTISALLGRLPKQGTERPATEYEFRIRALTDAGRSPRSPAVTKSPAVAPTPVENLAAAAVNDSTLAVSWDPPDDNGGLPVTHYDIQWRIEVFGWSQSNQGTTTDTSFQINNLTDNSFYDIRVAAANSVAGNDWAETSIYLPEMPAKPTDVVLYAGDGRITADWQLAPTVAMPVTSTIVSWRRTGTGLLGPYPWRTASVLGDKNRAHEFTSLANGTTYRFRFATTNKTGQSDWTSIVTATPTAHAQAPQNLTVDADHKQQDTSNQIRVTWDKGTQNTRFRVRWRPSTSTTFNPNNILDLGSSARRATIDVIDDRAYIIQVTASSDVADFQNAAKTATVAGRPYTPWQYLSDIFVPRYEDDHPWVREVFDEYPGLPISVETNDVGGAYITSVLVEPDGWELLTDGAVTLPNTVWDDLPRDDTAEYVTIHELAHVYTLEPRFMNDAMAVLFLQQRLNTGRRCSEEVVELLADTVTYETLGFLKKGRNNNGGYWSACGLGNRPFSGLRPSADSAVKGEMPAWFADTYMDSNGVWDHEQVWDDLTDYDEDYVESPFRTFLRTWGFRSFFGGYCSHEEARDALYELNWDQPVNENSDLYDDVTTNPWRDGGCMSRRPRDVAVTAGDGLLEISWKKPLWTEEPEADGYLVQWKGPNDQYHSGRQIILDGLTNNRSVTIENLANNALYTVRIAAIDVDKPAILRDNFGHQRYTEVNGRPSA